jgi:DNA-directed RNA polymerase specialized sigma24 family protein
MGYINNYGYNRKKMEKEFAEIAAVCREDGMPEEDIEVIHRLMLDILNNDRRFYVHTQSYDGLQFADGDEADEGRSPLLDKFGEQLSVRQAEICEWDRLAWIDDIDTPEIVIWLKSLSEDDLFMLTLLIVDGMRQREVAKVLEKHDSAISRKVKRLRESLTKVLPERLKMLRGI